MWLCNVVLHIKIRLHCLHFSDFPPEWRQCADTNCSKKILQNYESEQRCNFHRFAIDFLSCGSTTWSFIQRLNCIVYTSPTFLQNGTHVQVQIAQTRCGKATKVTKAKAYLTHQSVFLSNFCHITLRSSSFKCNICQKKFQTNIKLEEHYTNKHMANIISMHQCSSCDYSTMNKYYIS